MKILLNNQEDFSFPNGVFIKIGKLMLRLPLYYSAHFQCGCSLSMESASMQQGTRLYVNDVLLGCYDHNSLMERDCYLITLNHP
jgi:hypothetical protein